LLDSMNNSNPYRMPLSTEKTTISMECPAKLARGRARRALAGSALTRARQDHDCGSWKLLGGGLHRRMATMPVRHALVGMPGPDEQGFIEVAPHQLEADGQAPGVESAGQRDRRAAREVERPRESHRIVDATGARHDGVDLRVRRVPEGLDRRYQQVDAFEDLAQAALERETLVFDAHQVH